MENDKFNKYMSSGKELEKMKVITDNRDFWKKIEELYKISYSSNIKFMHDSNIITDASYNDYIFTRELRHMLYQLADCPATELLVGSNVILVDIDIPEKYNKVRKINNDKEDEIITIKELLDNDEYSDNKEIYSIDNFGIFSLIDVSTIDTDGNSVEKYRNDKYREKDNLTWDYVIIKECHSNNKYIINAACLQVLTKPRFKKIRKSLINDNIRKHNRYELLSHPISIRVKENIRTRLL